MKQITRISALPSQGIVWDIVCCCLLFVLSMTIWIPSRFFPLFWDTTYVIKTATQIYDSNFTRFVSDELGYAHPVLFPTILATLWKFFGTSSMVAHVLMLPFLPILLISAYLYISKLTNREWGFLGATLLGFTPVILAEYVNAYTDLPMASLIALSMVMWQRKKYVWWSFIFCASILIKIPAVAIVPFFILDALYQKNSKKTVLSILVPISVVALWFFYHHLVTGWWFMHANPGQNLAVSRDIMKVVRDSFSIFIQLFINQGKWLLSITAICSLIFLILYKVRFKTSELFIFSQHIVPLCIAAALFAATGEFAYRYAIYVNIFFYTEIILVIYKLCDLFPHIRGYFLSFIVCIVIFFSTLWHPTEKPITSYRFQPPSDLGIIDYLQVFRWFASYAEVNSSKSIIFYGGFPENISVLEPKMGFVSKPANFKNCSEFVFNSNMTQIIVMHPFSPTLFPCKNIITQYKLSAFAGKEINGKWIDLYKVATSSAQKM